MAGRDDFRQSSPADRSLPLTARLVLALLALALVGCSEAAPAEPTATPVYTEPTPSLRWLAEERQERLADTVETLRLKHGWAAGCVFRYNADPTIFDEFARPAGRAAYSFVADPDLAPAVVLIVERSTSASGSYREHIPDPVSFCYVAE